MGAKRSTRTSLDRRLPRLSSTAVLPPDRVFTKVQEAFVVTVVLTCLTSCGIARLQHLGEEYNNRVGPSTMRYTKARDLSQLL